MKVLDRYLIRELLFPIFFMTLALIFLILIADLFDNLDELLRHKTPFGVILRYYFSLIPYAFTQIIAWATWLGMVFLLANLGFHNETLAMKAVGLKITTIVRPLLFTGFLIGIFTFLVSDRVVPPTFRAAHELREIYIEKKKAESAEAVSRNVTYYAQGDELYFFRLFSKAEKKVEGVVALWLGEENSGKRRKMVAKRGFWNGTFWEFEGVTEYLMDARGNILGEPKTIEKKAYPEVSISPSELSAASSQSTFLTYRQLKQWTEKLKENGVDVYSEGVDLHNRLAAPWQGLVMMLVSIPILARTSQRRFIAFNMLIAVGIVFSYHVFGAVGTALGQAGKFFPFLSVWMANIAFGAAACAHLNRANY